MKAKLFKILLFLPFLIVGLTACEEDDEGDEDGGTSTFDAVKDKTIDDEDDDNNDDDNNDDNDIVIDGSLNLLCIQAEEDNVTVSLDGNVAEKNIMYSLDKRKWNNYKQGVSVSLDNGGKVYFAGDNHDGLSSKDKIIMFAVSGKISASGDIMSLIDYTLKTDKIPCDYCFAMLFYACKDLVSAPELSAKSLTKYCYYRMFESCNSLEKASSLNAQILNANCYEGMFRGCSSLETPPAIKAERLASNCCTSMFENCSSLLTSPELMVEELKESCYCRMFKGCTSLEKITVGFTQWHNTATVNWTEGVGSKGVFVCPETLDNKTDNSGNYIPKGWTIETE